MYRIVLLERVIHDLLARFWSLVGLAGNIYLGPLNRLVRRRSGNIKILFLCKGNICRSVYAEVVLRHYVSEAGVDRLALSSAGLDAKGGDPAYPTATDVAGRRQIDLRAHRTTRCTGEVAGRADLIIAMEPYHLRKLGRLSADGRRKAILLGALLLDQGEKLTTPDPYGKSEEVFSTCFDKIDRAMKVLLERVEDQEGGVERSTK